MKISLTLSDGRLNDWIYQSTVLSGVDVEQASVAAPATTRRRTAYHLTRLFSSGQDASPPLQPATSAGPSANIAASRGRLSECLVRHSAMRLTLNEYFDDRALQLQMPEGAVIQRDATDYHSPSFCQLQPEPGIVFHATYSRLHYRSATARLMENAGNVLLLPSAIQLKATPGRQTYSKVVLFNHSHSRACGTAETLMFMYWQTAGKFQTHLFAEPEFKMRSPVPCSKLRGPCPCIVIVLGEKDRNINIDYLELHH